MAAEFHFKRSSSKSAQGSLEVARVPGTLHFQAPVVGGCWGIYGWSMRIYGMSMRTYGMSMRFWSFPTRIFDHSESPLVRILQFGFADPVCGTFSTLDWKLQDSHERSSGHRMDSKMSSGKSLTCRQKQLWDTSVGPDPTPEDKLLIPTWLSSSKVQQIAGT